MFPATITAPAGSTLTLLTVAGLTVMEIEPGIPLLVAVIVTVPGMWLINKPVASTVAKAELALDQTTLLVITTLVVPSEYVPLATKLSVPPAATDVTVDDVTAIEVSSAGVTVSRLVVLVITTVSVLVNEAVMPVSPIAVAAAEEAKPVCAPIMAMVVVPLDHVTDVVISPVEPSE